MDKNTFLNAFKCKVVPVKIGDFDLHIKEWDGKARDRFDSFTAQKFTNGVLMSLDGISALKVVLSLCDAQGTLMFGDGDIAAVKKLPASVIEEVCGHIDELNGLKMTEESVGNSQGAENV